MNRFNWLLIVVLPELEALPGTACCKGIFSKRVTDNICRIKGIKGAVLELFFSEPHCRSISETLARKPERLK